MAFDTEFGFLREPAVLESPRFRIVPVTNHAEIAAQLHEKTHQDGHFYPPPSYSVSERLTHNGVTEERVPRSERPALTFHLPASHQLRIESPGDTDPISGDAGFLVQAVAYLFGTRLQVGNWALEGRVPIERSTNAAVLTKKRAERFLDTAYARWLNEPSSARLRMTNILYMHSKAAAYEWTWEQFFVEYLVTDAIYRWLEESLLVHPVTQHSDRIREMCRVGVRIPPDASIIEEIISARNELFHEAFWEGEKPGFKLTQARFTCLARLRSLNHHLIAAAFGGPTRYTLGEWWDTSMSVFFE